MRSGLLLLLLTSLLYPATSRGQLIDESWKNRGGVQHSFHQSTIPWSETTNHTKHWSGTNRNAQPWSRKTNNAKIWSGTTKGAKQWSRVTDHSKTWSGVTTNAKRHHSGIYNDYQNDAQQLVDSIIGGQGPVQPFYDPMKQLPKANLPAVGQAPSNTSGLMTDNPKPWSGVTNNAKQHYSGTHNNYQDQAQELVDSIVGGYRPIEPFYEPAMKLPKTNLPSIGQPQNQIGQAPSNTSGLMTDNPKPWSGVTNNAKQHYSGTHNNYQDQAQELVNSIVGGYRPIEPFYEPMMKLPNLPSIGGQNKVGQAPNKVGPQNKVVRTRGKIRHAHNKIRRPQSNASKFGQHTLPLYHSKQPPISTNYFKDVDLKLNADPFEWHLQFLTRKNYYDLPGRQPSKAAPQRQQPTR